MIARVTDAMKRSGNLVVNLAPLPRYQNICCGYSTHELLGEDNPGTLNTLLRDVGAFMGRSDLLKQSFQKNVVVSLMDVVAFLRSQISKDNVHPTPRARNLSVLRNSAHPQRKLEFRPRDCSNRSPILHLPLAGARDAGVRRLSNL